MNTALKDDSDTPTDRRGYSEKEWIAALEIAMFLYELWCKRNEKCAIIKEGQDNL